MSAELAAIADIGAQAHAELRAVIDGLAPPELDGLAESLRRYAQLAARAYGVEVLGDGADLLVLEPRVQAAAFRVGQAGAEQRAAPRGRHEDLRAADADLPPGGARGVGRRDRVQLRAPAAAGASGGLGLALMRGSGRPRSGGTLRITLGNPASAPRSGWRAGLISVRIVDDDPVVRQGLRALLEVQDDMAVAGEAGDEPAAIPLAESLRPDIVLLDLKLPGMDGVAVLRLLRAAGLRVLVLTSATEPSTAAAAARAGAAARCTRASTPPRSAAPSARCTTATRRSPRQRVGSRPADRGRTR